MNFLIPRCFLYELSILFFVTVTIKRRSVYKSLIKLIVSKEKLYVLTDQLTLANMGTDTQECVPHAFHCRTVLRDIFFFFFFFFFLRRYNSKEVLAFSTNSFHLERFLMQSLQFIFIFVISLFTSSSVRNTCRGLHPLINRRFSFR
jgi:hypothetical protein